MPMLNPATGDFHDFLSLTDNINRIEYQPNQLTADLNVQSKGLKDRYAAIDTRSEGIDIIEPRNWESKPGVAEINDYDTKVIMVPHRSELVTIRPHEVRSKRRQGSDTEYEMPETRLNEKFDFVKRKYAVSDEHQLVHACFGKMVRRDGSVYMDLAAQLGVGPTQINVDFDDADLDVVGTGRQIKRSLEVKLGEYTVDRWKWYLPADQFEALVSKESIKAAYDRWQEGAFLRQDNRGGFLIADNVEVCEYRNVKLGGVHDLFPTNKSLFLPIAAGLYQRRYAPAEDMVNINEEGLPFYAMPEDLPFAKGIDILTQSNAVTYMARNEAAGEITP